MFGDTIRTPPSTWSNPKKIDRFFYLKSESLLREQIEILQNEIRYLRNELKELRNPVVNQLAPPEVPIKINTAIRGRKLTPHEMEIIDRENYWKTEIARRAAEAKISQPPEVSSEDVIEAKE